MYNIREIRKCSFMEQYPELIDPNFMEETKTMKNESKKIFKVRQKYIYKICA